MPLLLPPFLNYEPFERPSMGHYESVVENLAAAVEDDVREEGDVREEQEKEGEEREEQEVAVAVAEEERDDFDYLLGMDLDDHDDGDDTDHEDNELF